MEPFFEQYPVLLIPIVIVIVEAWERAEVPGEVVAGEAGGGRAVMTRPKGHSTSSTPGESELAGRQEPRRPRPASASDALAARTRGASGSDPDEPEFGEVATDAMLDAKEEAKARRRKKPGPTREGGPRDGTGAGGIPDLLMEPTESTEPTAPTRATDGPGG